MGILHAPGVRRECADEFLFSRAVLDYWESVKLGKSRGIRRISVLDEPGAAFRNSLRLPNNQLNTVGANHASVNCRREAFEIPSRGVELDVGRYW